MRTRRANHSAFLCAFFLIPAMAGMLLFPVDAHAQQKTSGFFSGGYLRELCQRKANGKEVVKGGHTACQSYIAGVIDYHMLMKSLGTAPTIDFCVPNTEPMKKLQDIVWVFLEENKQHSEFIAAPAVTLALYEYYPCKKPKRKRRR
jgi:Rap1a immunity proteins